MDVATKDFEKGQFEFTRKLVLIAIIALCGLLEGGISSILINAQA